MSTKGIKEEPHLPRPIGENDLAKKANELGIKYFYTSITSLNLGTRAPIIPRCAIRKTQMNGFHIWGFFYYGLPPNNADIFCAPDPETLFQLPWDPAYGWLSCELYQDDRQLPQCPRKMLKKQLSRAQSFGLVPKTGIEVEFVLLKPDKMETCDEDIAIWKYQDPCTEMRHAKFLTGVLDAMDTLGWGPYEAIHEMMPCQYEINFNYADALTSSDRFAFMKFMIKHLAEKEGMRATFMPLVFEGPMPVGNGLHIHLSLWSAKEDINMIPDKEGELGLSQTGRHFLGGLMKHLPAITAIACSQINSYKRLYCMKNCLHTHTYGQDTKMPAVRIVREHGVFNRFEIRVPDPSTNPYFLLAAIIAAGLDGIENSIEPDPTQRMEEDLLDKETPKGISFLPRTLEEALEELQKDVVLGAQLGEEVIQSYIGIKKFQLEKFMTEITPFETKLVDVY